AERRRDSRVPHKSVLNRAPISANAFFTVVQNLEDTDSVVPIYSQNKEAAVAEIGFESGSHRQIRTSAVRSPCIAFILLAGITLVSCNDRHPSASNFTVVRSDHTLSDNSLYPAAVNPESGSLWSRCALWGRIPLRRRAGISGVARF